MTPPRRATGDPRSSKIEESGIAFVHIVKHIPCIYIYISITSTCISSPSHNNVRLEGILYANGLIYKARIALII